MEATTTIYADCHVAVYIMNNVIQKKTTKKCNNKKSSSAKVNERGRGKKIEVRCSSCTVNHAGSLNAIALVHRYFQCSLTKYINCRDWESLWGS